jgi:hypothetical protein
VSNVTVSSSGVAMAPGSVIISGNYIGGYSGSSLQINGAANIAFQGLVVAFNKLYMDVNASTVVAGTSSPTFAFYYQGGAAFDNIQSNIPPDATAVDALFLQLADDVENDHLSHLAADIALLIVINQGGYPALQYT